MRLFKRYNKRVMATMVLAGAVILGNAFAAFATHEACTDEPAGSPNSVHAGTQDSWVWVSQPGPISGVIGVDANNLAAVTGTGTVVYCQSTIGTPVGSPSGGDLTITTSNGSSPGKYVSTSGTGQFVPATTGQTGAEVGTISGTSVSGTKVYVDGLSVATNNGLEKPRPTAVTTGAPVPVCLGVCVFPPGPPYKVDSGYDAIVASQRVKACVSVGTSC